MEASGPRGSSHPRPLPLRSPRRHPAVGDPPSGAYETTPRRSPSATLGPLLHPVKSRSSPPGSPPRKGTGTNGARTTFAFVAALDNVLHSAYGHETHQRTTTRCDLRPERRLRQLRAHNRPPRNKHVSSQSAEVVRPHLRTGAKPDSLHWLRANGMPKQGLDWFAELGTSERFIIGHDYYRGNERSSKTAESHDPPVLIDVDSRPWLSTSTPATGCRSCSGKPTWRAPTPRVVGGGMERHPHLKDRGLPIRGFCWYGFVDHVDWDTPLTRNRGKVNTCGLVGLDRRPHAVGQLYRQLATAALDGRYPRLGRRNPSGAVSLVQ